MMSSAAEGENLFEFRPKRSNSSYQIVPIPTQLERKGGAEWPRRDGRLSAPVAGQWRAAGCQQSGCWSCLMLQCSCREQPCPQLTRQRGHVCHIQTGKLVANGQTEQNQPLIHHLLLQPERRPCPLGMSAWSYFTGFAALNVRMTHHFPEQTQNACQWTPSK